VSEGMTPERRRQVTEVFHAARSRDAAARAKSLDDVCVGDRALRDEVNAMLAVSIDERPRLDPGAMVGPYRVDRLIGTGGMGEVYPARDTKLGREVVVILNWQEELKRLVPR
jgi:serine/threonine protein kinase